MRTPTLKSLEISTILQRGESVGKSECSGNDIQLEKHLKSITSGYENYTGDYYQYDTQEDGVGKALTPTSLKMYKELENKIVTRKEKVLRLIGDTNLESNGNALKLLRIEVTLLMYDIFLQEIKMGRNEEEILNDTHHEKGMIGVIYNLSEEEIELELRNPKKGTMLPIKLKELIQGGIHEVHSGAVIYVLYLILRYYEDKE